MLSALVHSLVYLMFFVVAEYAAAEIWFHSEQTRGTARIIAHLLVLIAAICLAGLLMEIEVEVVIGGTPWVPYGASENAALFFFLLAVFLDLILAFIFTYWLVIRQAKTHRPLKQFERARSDSDQ